MQGHFDLTMLETPGLTQEVIEAVRREGGDPKVEALLREFKREGEWHTDNLVYQYAPSYLWYLNFGGSDIPPNMTSNSGSWSFLGYLTLTSTAPEVVYTGDVLTPYWSNDWQTAVPDNVGSNPSKRFIDDCIVTPDFKLDALGREAIYSKYKWLYLPGQATSSVIRSLSISATGAYSSLTAYGRCRFARVRIKDSGGNPVTISKAATRSLLVEYTFTLPTL